MVESSKSSSTNWGLWILVIIIIIIIIAALIWWFTSGRNPVIVTTGNTGSSGVTYVNGKKVE